MPRAADAVALSVLALLAVGVVMVNSAGLAVGSNPGINLNSFLLSRSTLYAALAVAAMLAVAKLPLQRLADKPRNLRLIPFLLPLLIAALLLVYLPVVGHEVNGARRWLILPGTSLTIQPSELAKWGLLIIIAWHAARAAAPPRIANPDYTRPPIKRFTRGALPALLVIALLAGAVTKEDLGTGVLMAAAGFTILFAAGTPLLHLLTVVPFALLGFVIAVVTSPYRLTRLTTFLDPYADPQGDGYHMIQSLVAVANGQGFGRGLGFGLQKFGYLPEDRTDFLFAVISEELGIAGATLVIALYITLLWAALSIVRKQHNLFLKLLALGVTTTVALQALMNLAVVTALAPTKGIALPLISSGGTGWILTAASLGLLIAMDKQNASSTAATHADLSITPEAPTSPCTQLSHSQRRVRSAPT